MKISIWKDGRLRDASLNELKTTYGLPTWIDVADPTIEELGKLAEALEIPRHVLIGRLRSNYPHADTYFEYTKLFAWQLGRDMGKDFSFSRSPIIVFTNKVSAITISPSRTGIREKIAEEFDAQSHASISVPARVIYLTMSYILETYEGFAEEFESATEKFEEAIPPWPRYFYTEAFRIRREASHLLRLLRHFRMLAECLATGNSQIPFTGEEMRILDSVYDRAVGTEETTETSLETIRDLISLHLDTLSHDMNRAMRLIAAMTAIVAIPSVINSLLGMNLVGIPWPWELWQVAIVSISVAVLLATYFYRKGWLRGT